MNKHTPFSLISLCMLCILWSLSGCTYSGTSSPEAKQMLENRVVQQLDETLDRIWKRHPAVVDHYSQNEDLINSARKELSTGLSRDQELVLVRHLFTQIAPDWGLKLNPVTASADSRYSILNIPVIWLSDGYYTLKTLGPIPEGSRLLSINGFSMNKIEQMLQPYSMTMDSRKLKTVLPDLLTDKALLSHTGILTENSVTLTAETGGTAEQAQLTTDHLTELPHNNRQPSRTGALYSAMDHGIMLYSGFRNSNNHFNEQNRAAIDEFFTVAAQEKPETIIIDLRGSCDGNSMIGEYFFSYLPGEKWLSIDSEIPARNSDMSLSDTQRDGVDGDVFKTTGGSLLEDWPVKEEHIYKGNIVALTNLHSSGIGTWIALIIQDNSLGAIVGEKTLHSLNEYSDYQERINTAGYTLYIPVKKFSRTGSTEKYTAVEPDIIVNETIESYLPGNEDLLLNKVIKLINTGTLADLL